MTIMVVIYIRVIIVIIFVTTMTMTVTTMFRLALVGLASSAHSPVLASGSSSA